MVDVLSGLKRATTMLRGDTRTRMLSLIEGDTTRSLRSLPAMADIATGWDERERAEATLQELLDRQRRIT